MSVIIKFMDQESWFAASWHIVVVVGFASSSASWCTDEKTKEERRHLHSTNPAIIRLLLHCICAFLGKGRVGGGRENTRIGGCGEKLPFIPHNIVCISSFERAFLFSGKDVRLLLCRQMQANG